MTLTLVVLLPFAIFGASIVARVGSDLRAKRAGSREFVRTVRGSVETPRPRAQLRIVRGGRQ